MGYRPSATLRSRSFVGLLIAQFLAAFNDQAIHASAMFFAFHMHLMNEKSAISLMPILFYAPWAVFCTVAGWCADRFSKRQSLVFWKFAEIAICVIALIGFYLGDHHHMKAGPILVLACVFLMGMHSAFFVPAKYGVMPEILEPQILSRGNGALESLSFLAVILGTVCGGVLSFVFYQNETWIGVVLLILAVIGALASLMIERMPAANPSRPFPPYIYGPLKHSLATLLGSRPLTLAVVGIAFFTFVVAYMRQTVYMLGESQTPRWDEMKTSLVVGSTALGIGLGSPLAGFLSGRKIELGLVPLGGFGMILASLLATLSLHWVPGLVCGIIAMGFFTGFYLVPMYTLLQHRAPKTSKGDAVAISNFINVTGAILASFLFFELVSAFQSMGYAKRIEFDNGREGELLSINLEEGRLVEYEIAGIEKLPHKHKDIVLWASENLPSDFDPDAGDSIIVVEHRGQLRNKTHIYLHVKGETCKEIYDNSGLPGFLFIGAGIITGLILLGLFVIQPDLPRRAAWAFRCLSGPRVSASGTHNVPLTGPVLFVTNCKTVDETKHVRSATDRVVQFMRPLDRLTDGDQTKLTSECERLLALGQVIGLGEAALTAVGSMNINCPILPVYIGHIGTSHRKSKPGDLHVAFGTSVPAGTAAADLAEAIRAAALTADDDAGHG